MTPTQSPRKRRPRAQPDWPWRIPAIDDPDIFALQALACGIANDAQQKRAYAFITGPLTEPDKMTFWPGGHEGERATSFAEGKRWVASQLRRIINLRPDTIVNRENGFPAIPSGKETA